MINGHWSWDGSDRGTVTRQFVGTNRLWNMQFAERTDEKSFRCLGVAIWSKTASTNPRRVNLFRPI